MPNKFEYIPINVLSGVDKDNTALTTRHWTDSNNIRFYDGKPRKIGGNSELVFDRDNSIDGTARTIYSQTINNRIVTLIGTNTRLYSIIGTELTNITPLVTTTTPIPNSINTNYQTLGSNPATTTISSTDVVITSTAHILQAGDIIELSGFAGALNGIPAVELNATQIIRSTTTNTYTITVTTPATSSGAGGGGSIVEAASIITVDDIGHGFSEGDRVKILASTAVGGVPAGEINAEHIIRNVQTNTYDVVVSTVATSSVSAGGGASTTRQGQIPAGNPNGGAGIGYGVGRYGVGLYGVSKTSANNITFPRIWSFDRFGGNVILTAGDQTGVYDWDGSTLIAPQLIANAPTDIEYVVQHKNFIVTLGQGGVPNRVKWSDQGVSTTWIGTPQNQAGEDDIEGADKMISAAAAKNGFVIFTEGRQIVYVVYIGRPLVWDFRLLEVPDGLIARNARVSVNGVIYWMGNNNFWRFDGGNITPIPSNSETGHNYVRRFVFDDLNEAQKSKCFAWYNSLWDEIWFHYPDASSNEPNRVVRWSISERHFAPDLLDRTAAESPRISNVFPRLIKSDNKVYRHELGVNDDVNPLNWSLTTPLLDTGKDTATLGGIVPDSTQTGDLNVVVKGLEYPQDGSPIFAQPDGVARQTEGNYTVEPTTKRLSMNLINRDFQMTIRQTNILDGDWIKGDWRAELEPASERKK